jgi:hypothetical protein
MTKGYRYRDTITGRFMTKAVALVLAPALVVREKIKRRGR